MKVLKLFKKCVFPVEGSPSGFERFGEDTTVNNARGLYWKAYSKLIEIKINGRTDIQTDG